MQLCAILADVHVFDEPSSRTPLRLRLSFSDGSFIRLRVSGDASNIILDNLPLEGPFDLEEYGRVEVCDITSEIDPSLANAEIDTPRLIVSADQRIVGIALPRLGLPAFCFWTDSDELYWGDAPALEVFPWLPDEKAKIDRGILPADIASH